MKQIRDDQDDHQFNISVALHIGWVLFLPTCQNNLLPYQTLHSPNSPANLPATPPHPVHSPSRPDQTKPRASDVPPCPHILSLPHHCCRISTWHTAPESASLRKLLHHISCSPLSFTNSMRDSMISNSGLTRDRIYRMWRF